MRHAHGKAVDGVGPGSDETVILHPSVRTFLDALAAWRFRKAIAEAGRGAGPDVAASRPRRGRRGDRNA